MSTDTIADLPGRFCAPVPTIEGIIDCCLPCPVTDWVYSDREPRSREEYIHGRMLNIYLEFEVIPEVANWLNVGGMVCCVVLLISYLVLPVKQTSRHYLTVGLVVAICLMQVRFRCPRLQRD